MWPYTWGFLASASILMSIPITKENYEVSMGWNKREIMEKRYAATQNYHK